MVLRMKNFNILGFTEKIRLLGGRGGFEKNHIEGGNCLKGGGGLEWFAN